MDAWGIVAALADVGELQRGFFTREQAAARGVDASVLKDLEVARVVEEPIPGVFLMRGHQGDMVLDRIYAQWLALAPETIAPERTATGPVLSHVTAAHWYGIGHSFTEVFTCTYPTSGAVSSPNFDHEFHRADLGAADWREHDGALVTSPIRTVTDLLDDFADERLIARVVREFVGRQLVDRSALAEALAPQAVQWGRGSADDYLTMLESHQFERGALPR